MRNASQGAGALFPQVEVCAATVAATGLLLGVAGVATALVKRRGGSGGGGKWPIVGAVACAAAITLAGPSRLLHSFDRSARANDPRVVGVSSTQSAVVPPPVQWTAADQPGQVNEVRVRVTSARIGRIPVVPLIKGDEPIPTAEEYLAITVEVQNLSSSAPLSYHSWAGVPKIVNQSVAALRDERGRVCHLCDFAMLEPIGRIRTTTINPGAATTDSLVFELPREGFHALRLELPGANVQVQSPYRFELPAVMVQREQAPARAEK